MTELATAEMVYEPTLEQTSKWQRFLAKMGIRVFLGNGHRKGWNGELAFYLFWCPKCKNFSVDHKHGLKSYLMCQNKRMCGVNIDF